MADPGFGGVMGETLGTSTPDWAIQAPLIPPEGAPNILLVLIDDAGFGNPSTFGGPIDTPNYTRMADAGLLYNRLHVTALCSPTRAALLTGRNHHAVGFGSIGELPGPFPGYTAARPNTAAPFPQVLQLNGYSTAAFGKWHMTPNNALGPDGPFDRWPNAWGFDHFWGFLGGESGQYDPMITENQTTHTPLGGPTDRDFYLPDALTDHAIGWLHGITAHGQEKPWFMYYSTGCSHAPHQVPPDWSAKYKGKFDMGWDEYRNQTFAKQKELGVIPADAELTPRPDAMPAWDSLSDAEKKYYARQMEVYAGYSENADYNVGRLIDELERMGQLEDTLVIWIWGDNGASLEGTTTGSFNEFTMQNGIPLTNDQQIALLNEYGGVEAWGGPDLLPHYSAAWAWAGNTPFQWGKQVASHLGGTRDPMVIHWPARIHASGEVRSQFTHVIDIGPTILDIAGIPQPTSVNGIEQMPVHGSSFKDSLFAADAPEHNTQQYFEIYGNRGIYKDGWWAASILPRIPWDASPATIAQFAPGVFDPHTLKWELYNLDEDFSQAHDVAEQFPDKVKELDELWWSEARKYDVLPLLAGLSAFFGIVPPIPANQSHTYWGSDVQNVPEGVAPPIKNRSYTITADLDVPAEGAEGVIVGAYDQMGGYSLYVKDGKLKHTYSFLGIDIYRQQSSVDLPAGRKVQVALEFAADTPALGTGGTVTLSIDGQAVGSGRMDRTVPIIMAPYQGLDIGADNGEVVDKEYEDLAPFAFSGTIEKVVFDIRQPADPNENAELHRTEHAERQARHIDS
ncbi:arylsulfatase [Leifsonia sp. NPDC058230]|uniref:arylsulfatase n=1 Tax=Leifsonia sp. NPDC058230 TaxID=3346391 RepID=UPI0036D791CB